MKEKARRRKCKVSFSIIKNNKAFQKNCMKVEVKKLLRAGMMPARTWGAHAVGISPTARLKLRGQMAAAAGKESTDIPVFVHGSTLEVEDESSTMTTQYWVEGVLDREMESRAERSADEADSRGSNVETGKRTCRSSDVRDP